MYKLERAEQKGDRARRRIQAHGESLVPTYANGMVQVECGRASSVTRLVRRGWTLVDDTPAPAVAKPAPPSAAKPSPPSNDMRAQLEAMSTKRLKALAKEAKVRGRSGMDRAALIEALLGA
jgi:hypothetical protein